MQVAGIKNLHGIVLLLAPFFVAACSDEDDDFEYPLLVNEMVDMKTNTAGTMVSFVTDAAQQYTLDNPQAGYKPSVVYRCVAGFEDKGGGKATLYTLESVYVLRDSAAVLRHDPLKAVAVWRGGAYVNMQLSPMTQGGMHSFGFAIDSVCGHTYHLSLHHNQNADRQSYSTTVYASLPVDSIGDSQTGDTLALDIHTFSGCKRWTFIK